MDQDIRDIGYKNISDEDKALLEDCVAPLKRHFDLFGRDSTLDVLAAIGLRWNFTDAREHRKMVRKAKQLSTEKNKYSGRHKDKKVNYD